MSTYWVPARSIAIDQEPDLARETLLNILYDAIPEGHYRVRRIAGARDSWPTFAVDLDAEVFQDDLQPACGWRHIAQALHAEPNGGLLCRIR